jgi:hypothetical protein
MNDNTSWVDVLTEGRIWRSLIYLLWTFVTGMGYIGLLAGGFGTAFGLSFILIGIPLLVMAFAGARGLASLDRKIGGALIEKDLPPLVNDIPRGQSIFGRLGSLMASPMSWLSIVYLLTKFPAGIFSIIVLPMIMPLLLLEVLLLAPLGITRGTIAMHVVNGLASGIASFSNSLLPTEPDDYVGIQRQRRSTEKMKRDGVRDISRLEIIDEDDERYYIDEEGEIVEARRKR